MINCMVIGTLSPAYGRDYKSKKEIVGALNKGTDFLNNTFMGGSQPLNLENLVEAQVTSVTVRYARMTKCVIIKITGGVAK